MKIKNLKTNENFRSSGLIFNEMRNLKQIVALFGKNGSGKTRLLKNLQIEINNKIGELNHLETQLNPLVQVNKRYVENKQLQDKITNLIDEKEQLLRDYDFKVGDAEIFINARHVNISPNDNMTENEFRSGTLQLINNPSFESIKQNCAKFIKSICKSEIAQEYHDKVKNKKHFVKHDEIGSKNIELFNFLKELVKEIMKKELDYATDEHLNPIIKLDGWPLTPNELSDGEKELLAYCTFLVLQSQDDIPNKSLSLRNKILLLDELELFLHPKAQIDLINGLRRLVGENGQIWLATHSLAILSILDRDEVWLMENGDIISPSIETPNKVLTSLIGEENIDSLENFISSQYEWASIQFALESLFPPTVTSFKANDFQQLQIKDRLLSSSKQVKILDFGAGKGRIGQEIFRNKTLASQVFYQPLEVNDEYHDDLKELTRQLQLISNFNTDVEREILDTHEKLNESKYNNFFDFIFLINVLHEIPLHKWNSILNILISSLGEDGKLVILEDQAIPRGENAHEYGFLIFDIEELKILFSNPDSVQEYRHKDTKYSDRLTCVEIPKKGSLVNNNTIIDSLQRKKTNCKKKINHLRQKIDKKPKDGRSHSFYTQLYANVDMALSDLIN